MIRKGIITVLTLAAVATALLWSQSWHHIRSWVWYTSPMVKYCFDDNSTPVTKQIYITGGKLYIEYYELIDKNILSSTHLVEYTGFRWSTTIRRHRLLLRRRHGNTIAYVTDQEQRELKQLKTKQLWQLDICIPLWSPFILFATYPTISFIRGPLRRYRRRRKGLCIQCGYNLRGNTTGICSECGMEIIQ